MQDFMSVIEMQILKNRVQDEALTILERGHREMDSKTCGYSRLRLILGINKRIPNAIQNKKPQL